MPFLVLHSVILIILSITYIVSLFCYIYKKKKNLPDNMASELWAYPRQMIAYNINTFGKIWHGYEVIGMEHLPEEPGLIVYYHCAVTIDYACFVARVYSEKGRLLQSVIHYLHHFIPGLTWILDIIGCTSGKKADCVEILKNGILLEVAPGGLREQNFSDENLSLVWGNHTGFAQVALEAKVPIIPLFTQNIREGYRIIGKTRLTRRLYECAGILFLPIYGGFPVKLRTYVGEPIPYDPNITATELAEKGVSMSNKHMLHSVFAPLLPNAQCLQYAVQEVFTYEVTVVRTLSCFG